MNRIWIYQSKRPLSAEEQQEINAKMTDFITRWAAHKVKLDARFEILHSHFITLSVNEEQVMASGCSIDDSVRFMQALDDDYGLALFDRMNMAYVGTDGEIHICNLGDISALYHQGALTDDSTVFNNTIQDAGTMQEEWKIPFKSSGYFAFK